MEELRHLSGDMKATLLQLNIADDYFKAKTQAVSYTHLCGCIGFIRRSGNIGSDRKDGKDMELTELCKSAKEVSRQIGNLDTNTKNEVLRAAAEAIVAHTEEIIRENEKDLARGRENHMPEGLLDRLMLNPSRMEQMAEEMCIRDRYYPRPC